jgi:DNA-binding MarR family transcriptional regulator
MSPVEGGTVNELAAFAQVHPGYARKILKRMEAVGLVRHEDRQWFSNKADLDDVAVTVGTAGKGATRKARNDARRAKQREVIETWKKNHRLQRTVQAIHNNAAQDVKGDSAMTVVYGIDRQPVLVAAAPTTPAPFPESTDTSSGERTTLPLAPLRRDCGGFSRAAR